MERWTCDGGFYEENSMYRVSEDAWTYELAGPYEMPGRLTRLAVIVPDATPDDRPFTPMGSAHARVVVDNGQLPWPILLRFVRLVEASGDIVAAAEGPEVTGDLALSLNSWQFAGRQFEVNSFHFDDRDSWCYELHETEPARADNNYIDVCIPDLQPAAGPFVPATAERVTFTAHGSWTLPWPVFRHFLNQVAASGDIVDDSARAAPSHNAAS